MTHPHGSISRGLILLRSSNGARLLDRPRDMPGYEGRGASTALLLACGRLRDKRGDRALVLDEMAAKQVKREQGRRGCGMSCACYCPRCGVDLVSEPGTTHTDTDLVRYNCGACGTRSEWLFDAPVPLLISPRLERLANKQTAQGRSLWGAVASAARAVREWPLWKRGRP